VDRRRNDRRDGPRSRPGSGNPEPARFSPPSSQSIQSISVRAVTLHHARVALKHGERCPLLASFARSPARSALQSWNYYLLPQVQPVTSNLDLKIQTADYGQGGGGKHTNNARGRNSFGVKILT